MSMLDGDLKVCVVQMMVTVDKQMNIQHACERIKSCVSIHKDVDVIILPECWNSEYSVRQFRANSEHVPSGQSCTAISNMARECKVWIIAGTIPEIGDDDNVYNTCAVFDNHGDFVAKYSKMHLFDIDIPNKIKFTESESLTPGNTITTITINGWRIGIGICYDLRFSELAYVYCHQFNVDMLVYPGAFNMTTGPLHWTLLQRARAVDNQVYVLTASQARDVNSSYVSYGYSAVTDPWGNCTQIKDDEGVVVVTCTKSVLSDARQSIPIQSQKRWDLYDGVKWHGRN